MMGVSQVFYTKSPVFQISEVIFYLGLALVLYVSHGNKVLLVGSQLGDSSWNKADKAV